MPGLFVASGLGSRGLTWAPLAGRLIASWVARAPFPLAADLVDALDPARFATRTVRAAPARRPRGLIRLERSQRTHRVRSEDLTQAQERHPAARADDDPLSRSARELQRLHARGRPEQADVRAMAREDADADDAGPLVDLGLERQRIGDGEAMHVEDGMAVVGRHARTHARIAAERGKAARDLRDAHADDFHRQREPPELRHALGLVGDADEPAREVGHDLLARERRAAALDHAALRIDLVGAVDVDVQALDLVGLQHREAVAAQALGGLAPARDRRGHALRHRSQRLDEVVHRGAGADAHDAAGAHVGDRGLPDQGLEFVLGHARIIPFAAVAPGLPAARDGWATMAAGSCRARPGVPRAVSMSLVPYALTRPFLFGLDPERAHEMTLDAIAALQNTPLQCLFSQPRIADPVTVAGLRFANRIGLAAGLDKNGRCIDGLGAMGFGFIEVGTVTPKAQPGNPKPRIFRLPKAGALINRLGFNNLGLDAFLANVKRARSFRAAGGILGLNIGKNAATPIENAVDDYLTGLVAVYPHADYVTVNISSPNTKNLRALQSDEALDALLGALVERRAALARQAGTGTKPVPMFLKIAPDLDEQQVRLIAATLRRHGLDGVIATNTTISRDAVRGLHHAQETGGLSGAPVLAASNAVIRQLRAALGPVFPIIGVGGVMSAEDARAKIGAGADLVQIYTGLIYRGAKLVREAALALKALTARRTRAWRADRERRLPLRWQARYVTCRRPALACAALTAPGAHSVQGTPVLAAISSRVTPGRLDELQPFGRHVDHAQVGDDAVDDTQAREGQRALRQDLEVGAAVLLRRDVLHQHDHAAHARHQVHRAAHALDHLARDHPVREVAFFADLHRAEDREVDLAAADHAEAVRAREDARAGQRRHRLLAGVDHVGVDLVLGREGADAQQAVLALQPNLHARGHVIGHHRGQADAEVDVEAVLKFLRGACRHLVSRPSHVRAPVFVCSLGVLRPCGRCAARCASRDGH